MTTGWRFAINTCKVLFRGGMPFFDITIWHRLRPSGPGFGSLVADLVAVRWPMGKAHPATLGPQVFGPQAAVCE
jgi:hypothetical protein